MELCLGTVQFGMDYGILNQKKPIIDDAIAMLDYATQNGIKTIDTAEAYGTAHEVVGEFIKRKTIARQDIQIISKLKPNILDDIPSERYYDVIKKNMMVSFEKLHVDYLDGYLLHSSRYIYKDAILDALVKMKKEGYARKVGVSVYETEEASCGISKRTIDLMQLPYSIFDQRMSLEGTFSKAIKEGSTQIHSRSAFLQGLILMDKEQIPSYLNRAVPIVDKIDKLCNKHGISRIALALGFVKKQEAISHLVFGVNNMNQLAENIELFNKNISNDIIDDIAREFKNIEADIVMPSLWKK